MADLLADIGGLLGSHNTGNIAQNSTSRPNNTELNMNDFLQLMIVQLTNQTIDDAMDTGEMMNQFLQMQMITALSNMNDISVQSYANSLVGKVVTIGILQDNVLEEREIVVKGVGTYNGQQVIFGHDGNMYFLNQIMAVGRLPDENGNYTDQVTNPGPTEQDSYIYKDDDGKETTVFVGADGKAGTEDDWYYAAAGEDGEEEKAVFVGADKTPGTGDEWYYSEPGEDGEEEKVVYVGADGTPGTADDWYYAGTGEDGEEEKVIYVGEDGKAGTADDWYYAGEDGEDKKFVGPDGLPGTEDDVPEQQTDE